MSGRFGFALLATVGLCGALVAGQAAAAVTVFGGDFAQECYKAAKSGRDEINGLQACNRAIESENLSEHDLAGTYVNRGVIFMDRKAFTLARRDFEQAIALDPRMGDALVNRGGALIGEHRYAEGIADITRGLALGSEEPAKAYYNRAIAYEALDNEKAAYFDYLKASELRPNWAAPLIELKRFTVTPK